MTLVGIWEGFAWGVLPLVILGGLLASTVFVVSPRLRRSKIKGAFEIVVAFSLLGLIFGYSTGNSREPAVSALLTVVLSIITMLLGFVFGKDQWSIARTLAPYCLLVLLIATFYGLILGAKNRQANIASAPSPVTRPLRELKVVVGE
jgi:hypothetical protein